MQNESVGLECGEAPAVADEAFWVEAVVLIVEPALKVIVELALGAGGVVNCCAPETDRVLSRFDSASMVASSSPSSMLNRESFSPMTFPVE